MTPRLILVFTLSLALAGCATVRDSRVNPLNWFGGGQAEPVVLSDSGNPLIPRREGVFAQQEAFDPSVTIADVVSLRVERVVSGAIIRAEGVAATQGWYDARLVPLTEDETAIDGELTYRFVAVPPPRARPVGPVRTRTITVARSISNATLSDARVIRVVGANTQQVTRRR